MANVGNQVVTDCNIFILFYDTVLLNKTGGQECYCINLTDLHSL